MFCEDVSLCHVMPAFGFMCSSFRVVLEEPTTYFAWMFYVSMDSIQWNCFIVWACAKCIVLSFLDLMIICIIIIIMICIIIRILLIIIIISIIMIITIISIIITIIICIIIIVIIIIIIIIDIIFVMSCLLKCNDSEDP